MNATVHRVAMTLCLVWINLTASSVFVDLDTLEDFAMKVLHESHGGGGGERVFILIDFTFDFWLPMWVIHGCKRTVLCLHLCVCVCVCVRAHVCVCMCMHTCVCVYAYIMCCIYVAILVSPIF